MSSRWRSEPGPYAGPVRSERQRPTGTGGDPARAPVPPFVPTPAPAPAPIVLTPGADLLREPRADPRAVPGPTTSPTDYEAWGAGASAIVAGPPPLAGSARPSSPAEQVADALETVALRVRTGELVPLGYEPGMTDAAAVATALTALLTARH